MNGKSYNCKPVTSGAFQESVLGSFLFLIFINDIPGNISSSIRLYSDDRVAYRVVIVLNECEDLQMDINRITS